MDDYSKYLDERLSALGVNSKTREAKLEEENKILRQQLFQQSNGDPLLTEFRNSPEHNTSRRDNFLTYLWFLHYPSWLNSEQGKAFEEWEKGIGFDEFKKKKNQQQNNGGL